MDINSVTSLTGKSAVDVISDDSFVQALKSNANVPHMMSICCQKKSNVSLLKSTASSGTISSKKKKNVDFSSVGKDMEY